MGKLFQTKSLYSILGKDGGREIGRGRSLFMQMEISK